MPDENGHIPGITRSLLRYNFVFTSKKNKIHAIGNYRI